MPQNFGSGTVLGSRSRSRSRWVPVIFGRSRSRCEGNALAPHGDVVAQWIECQTALLQFRGSIPAWVNSGIPNHGDHLLGREPGMP